MIKAKPGDTLRLTSNDKGIWLEHLSEGTRSYMLIQDSAEPEPIELEIEIEELEPRTLPDQCWPDILIES